MKRKVMSPAPPGTHCFFCGEQATGYWNGIDGKIGCCPNCATQELMKFAADSVSIPPSNWNWLLTQCVRMRAAFFEAVACRLHREKGPYR